jgi:hypothetical protein
MKYETHIYFPAFMFGKMSGTVLSRGINFSTLGWEGLNGKIVLQFRMKRNRRQTSMGFDPRPSK